MLHVVGSLTLVRYGTGANKTDFLLTNIQMYCNAGCFSYSVSVHIYLMYVQSVPAVNYEVKYHSSLYRGEFLAVNCPVAILALSRGPTAFTTKAIRETGTLEY